MGASGFQIWFCFYCCYFLPQLQVHGARSADELDGNFVVTEESHTWEHFHSAWGSSSLNGSNKVNISNLKEPEPPKATTDSNIDLLNVKYWGCYNFWSGLQYIENNNGNIYFKEFYIQNMTPQRCREACQTSEFSELFMIRGIQCTCTKWIYFDKTLIKDGYCNATCAGSKEDGELSCGGNLAVSVYCSTENDKNCSDNVGVKEQIQGYSLEYLENKNNEISGGLAHSKNCYKCTLPDGDCFKVGGFPQQFDYFPQNNPLSCMLNCRRQLEINGIERNFLTSYLTWRFAHPGVQVPVCVCSEKFPENENFATADAENCNQPCPLPRDNDDFCGNVNDIRFVNAFVLDEFVGNLPEPIDPEEEGETSTTPSATTQKNNTTQKEIPTTTPALTTTTIRTTTTTKASTTESTTTTTTEKHSPCTKQCRRIHHGVEWVGCPGDTVQKPCPNGIGSGMERWKCLENSSFEYSIPDSSNCSTPWYHELVENLNETLKKNNNTIPKESAELILRTMEGRIQPTGNNTRPYFGHEIKNLAGFIRQVVNASVKQVTLEEQRTLLDKSVTLSSFLLWNKQPWEELTNISHRVETGKEFLSSLEISVLTLSDFSEQFKDKFNASFETSNLSRDEFFVTFGTGNQESKSVLKFPITSSAHDSFLEVGEGWEDLVDNPNYVGYLIDSDHYKDIFPAHLHNITRCTGGSQSESFGKILNSKLLSLTIKGLGSSNSRSSNLQGKKVRITFQHDIEAWGNEPQNIPRKLHVNEAKKPAIGSAVCVFWSSSKNEWSNEGCNLIESTRSQTICECDHLTSFAVLMDNHNYVGKDFALEVLTFVLCPVSILCLLMSIIIFTAVNSIQSQRTTITKHLCSCLMIGMILLLFLVDRNYFLLPSGLCIAVGIITHYIYLAAFTWMAIEGVHLYKMVVHVFDAGYSRTTMYRVIAYGIPVLIVGITCVVGFLLQDTPYGGEMYCWLEGPYIWSFIIPVGLVVMGNLIILFVALKTAYQMKTSTVNMQARQRRYKTWIRGCFSITVLLGITWMPGFVMLSNSFYVTTISAYIFVILNASQGIFLFIFHCLMNEKVRTMAERNLSLPSWLSVAPNSSKEMSQTGYRSENMRAYYSEASKSFKCDPKPESRAYFTANPKDDVETRDKNDIWRRDSNFLDTDMCYPDILPERVLQQRSSDSRLSDSSQKYLVSTKRR